MSRPSGPFRVTVFCSANANLDPEFLRQAEEFSQGVAARGWELIYGGAKVGLMGHFADCALKHGGSVRGAITKELAAEREMPHTGLQELVIVNDLFERKRWLMDQGDAFLIFPGGYGTLDEALEVITWKALAEHSKPIMFVNVNGFWQSQLNVFKEFEKNGMIRSGNLGLFEVSGRVQDVWKTLDAYSKELIR